MAQYINLAIYTLITLSSAYVIIRNPRKKYEMVSWLFVGLLNAVFYAGVLFFDMQHAHDLSIVRSQTTAIVVLAYIFGYYILGEKYV